MGTMEDPVVEYNILNAVHENEGSLTQRNISEKIGRSVASVNFALRLMAVKGFIKISGANARTLRYHLTPAGVIRKTALAYNFLKRQRELYDDARNQLLGRLTDLAEEGLKKVAIYGWTPFTEAAILFLIMEGVKVTCVYVGSRGPVNQCNRIPVRFIGEFQDDCDTLVLLEPLPNGFDIATRVEPCFPPA